MKKIVHVQVIPKLSGVQQVSLDILSNLPDIYDKYIIFGGGYNPSDEFIRKFESQDVKIIFVPSLKREIGYLDVKAFCELFKIFREYKFDIVHTNSTKPGIVARFAAKLAGCRYVIHSVHGIAYHKFEKKHKRIFYYLVEFFFSFFSDVLVSVNRHYLKYYPFVRNKLCIHNAVTLRPATVDLISVSTLRKDKLRIGFMGRLDPQKDPLTLLQALKFGLETNLFTRQDVTLTMAGEGELSAQCMRFVEENNLMDVVNFRDWIFDKENFYSHIDVFCLPSIYEAFGLVLGEAAVFGVPSIATNVEGVPEVITDDESGFLVDAKDYQALAEKIGIYVTDDALRVKHGLNARRKVMSAFKLDDMIAKYEALYSRKSK
ncbi:MULTISPECIES: glycosyltransferase family 4 protein [unclassified Brenneria]|uniref:glycosyltransferase family 4 protein n=1 Tax=unclassified Brenneria TaxID=2634434 RepID=UPI0018F05E19|nr:glycosyltransferase family 4 protein [Brenneria sp. L3-3C-1]MBJ7221593.1 glycosyltransferase family 4 protein [Brenneria sp. L3-3C-1]MEE3642835.1 glycosyltransferase family 4 protein [Brenneria sp. L3_3C_1]